MGVFRRALTRRSSLQRRIQRHISVPGLPRARTELGSVWAVTMVRNEEDVIGHSIRHLLAQGVDHVLAVDNMSTDGTRDVLNELARTDARIHVGEDTLGAYFQGRKMSYLADLARRAGADWIVLFDADEFWFGATQPLATHLRSITSARVAQADVFDAHPLTIEGIDLNDPEQLIRVDFEPTSKKVAIRPRRWVWVDDGNHSALDLAEAGDNGLRIVHLQYRTFGQFDRKVTVGSQAVSKAQRALRPSMGSHWHNDAALSIDERRQVWKQRISGATGSEAWLPVRWRGWEDRCAPRTGAGTSGICAEDVTGGQRSS